MPIASMPSPSLSSTPYRPLLRPCPVCGGSAGHELGRLRYALFDDTPLADEYPVASCTSCGFVRCETPSSQCDVDRFYAEYRYSPAYLAHPIQPEDQRYYADTAHCLAAGMGPGRDALFDIGCGSGNFLRVCRSLGMTRLYAIDPSASCIAGLRQAGFQAEVGSTSAIPFPEIQPAVIVLSHIVEHLLDLDRSLQSVRQRMEDDTLLYVEVPDGGRYEEFEPSSPLRYFYLQHLVHFDRCQLDSLFSAHGFRKLEGGSRVRVEHELALPAIWATYRRDDAPPSFTPDFGLARRIQTWFDGSLLDPDGAYADLAHRESPVYIWGVGIHVQMLLGMSPLRHCNIVCCVDQDPRLHGKKLQGHRIAPVETLRQASENETVVIGSRIHRRKMVQCLREEIGFRGQILMA